MKASTICLVLIVSIFYSIHLSAQTNPLRDGYYIVVSAYAGSKEDYARRFVANLRAEYPDITYGFDTRRGLYLTYIDYFSEYSPAINTMLTTRSQGRFTDAWVRIVKNTTNVEPLATEKSPATINNPEGSSDKIVSNQPEETATESPVVPDSMMTPVVQEPAQPAPSGPPAFSNRKVYFNLANASNNLEVEGDVQVVDTERARLLGTVPGNTYTMLPAPAGGTGQISVICDIFGYRKLQQELNYADPLADTSSHVELRDSVLVVFFDLIRYRKGDIVTLYNVFFYNDAAIMRGESRYELSSLLNMMNENPRYRIKLHGHANGNYHGKIIVMGDDRNFFSLDGAKERTGSAKKLSEERASIIRDYLMANGVDGQRIEIKAWGGKRPLHDRHSVNASRNLRVEVEVLED